MDNLPDYGEYAHNTLHDAKAVMEKLQELVDEAHKYEAQAEKLEQQALEARNRLAAVVTDALPKLMQESGIESFKTKGGLSVSLKTDTKCNLAKKRQDAGLDWIEKHGGGSLIKACVNIPFTRAELAEAKKLADAIMEDHNRIASVERKIEPATMKKFLTDRMAKGKDVDKELFGIFEVRKAEIKVPKGKK